VAFVDEHDGVVSGFVLGSGDPEGMRRDALGANARRMLFRIVARVLRRPGVLRLLASGVAGPRGGGVDPRAPELTYIAVPEDARSDVGAVPGDTGLQLLAVAPLRVRGPAQPRDGRVPQAPADDHRGGAADRKHPKAAED
jgi:hypothetical protein